MIQSINHSVSPFLEAFLEREPSSFACEMMSILAPEFKPTSTFTSYELCDRKNLGLDNRTDRMHASTRVQVDLGLLVAFAHLLNLGYSN